MNVEASASSGKRGLPPERSPPFSSLISQISNPQGGTVSIECFSDKGDSECDFTQDPSMDFDSDNDEIMNAIASTTPNITTNGTTALPHGDFMEANNSVNLKKGPHKRSCSHTEQILAPGKEAESLAKSRKVETKGSNKGTNTKSSGSSKSSRKVHNLTYSPEDFGPFIVYIYAIPSESNYVTPHHLTMARIITNVAGNVLEIKSIGRGKSLVVLKSAQAANNLISSLFLKQLQYKAFIPSYLTSRSGVIRGITTDYSELFLEDNIRSSNKILKVIRLNRKITVDGKTKVVPSSIIRVIFEGKAFPAYVSPFHVRFKVDTYIPAPAFALIVIDRDTLAKLVKELLAVYIAEKRNTTNLKRAITEKIRPSASTAKALICYLDQLSTC
ncbi:uncharacterized protein LOC105202836 [Solenopsis invicta]|uniref:uncharacterized protein LOC105202836 n=1 Tax=Solenopsis invicta TaxID=13686 RepID=UPI0005960DF4|nr:uncharacterized protein LOC105202836 [Solenopsis invicta]XP_011169828.1 uncharacterized protein LOC105202836 [Solenopsis invicta]XP_025996712.1 uncharacterized protein LOC105202836 [Solenopsis invicta]